MAEGDCIVTNNLKEQLLLKTIDFVNDIFKMALYSVALASPDGNPVYTVVNEIAAATYVAGGALCVGNTVAQDDVNNRASFNLDDVTWPTLGAAVVLEARLYDNTTAPKHVICMWEIATNPIGTSYLLQFDATGVLLLT
jgi:hypothetical protein